jgi:hypothetical protein
VQLCTCKILSEKRELNLDIRLYNLMVVKPKMMSKDNSGSTCTVIDLRRIGSLSSPIRVMLHTILPTVGTHEPSAKVTTLFRSAAIIRERLPSRLAVVSLQKLENKQPVSIRQSMLIEMKGLATAAIVPWTQG